VKYTAFDFGMIAVAAVMGVILLVGCVDVPTEADNCHGVTNNSGDFWKCMDYRQRQNAMDNAVWSQVFSQPVPNPLAYMPVRRTTTCYSDGYGTMTCR